VKYQKVGASDQNCPSEPEFSPQIAAYRSLEIPLHFHAAVVIERQDLHQNDGSDLPFRIHPKVRVVDSRPGIAAKRTQVRVVLIRSRDLKSKAELVLSGTEREVERPERVRRLLCVDNDTTDINT